jgi:RHH-type rel operon transcriptional repressor/antitoxin RelB
MYDMYDMYDKRGPAMLSVRLPEDIEKRLEALAKATGRSKTYYVREALIQKLEDMEDIYLAEAVLERIRSGEEKVISAEEFWRGMDD